MNPYDEQKLIDASVQTAENLKEAIEIIGRLTTKMIWMEGKIQDLETTVSYLKRGVGFLERDVRGKRS